MCQFSFFFIGSAQLILSGTSVIEKNGCNETVVLPCYVTNLRQKNIEAMFVIWKKEGTTIFSYRGATKNFNIDPSFSSAKFLHLENLTNGDASLVLNSKQAIVGNYSCEVTESNREGEFRLELRNGSDLNTFFHSVIMSDLMIWVPYRRIYAFPQLFDYIGADKFSSLMLLPDVLLIIFVILKCIHPSQWLQRSFLGRIASCNL
uniref:Ig-like domain-containing protein n=1 Tax=Catharus ustulatus TaxID=91951 RepID=A0A8C3TQI6_CATUS